MVRKISLGIVATVLGITVGDAHAGLKSVGALTVTSALAHGQFATIRASADNVQFLACEIDTQFDDLAFSSVFCSARNAAGTQVSCFAGDAEFVDTARGINGDSYIEFRRDPEGLCVFLLVENASNLRPKHD